MSHTYSHLYGLPTTGLRFFTVYGPWDRPDMALQKFAKAIMSGKPIQLYNYGNHQRDFTFIDDIVEGVVRVLDQPAKPDTDWNSDNPNPGTSQAPWCVYNIGSNNPVELKHYVASLERSLGKKAGIELLPMQPGDVPNTYADVDSLIQNFGYKPETPVEKGVQKFADWYISYYN